MSIKTNIFLASIKISISMFFLVVFVSLPFVVRFHLKRLYLRRIVMALFNLPSCFPLLLAISKRSPAISNHQAGHPSLHTHKPGLAGHSKQRTAFIPVATILQSKSISPKEATKGCSAAQ